MRTTPLNLLMALCVGFAMSIAAYGQPLFPHAKSIEATVANADLVFIAKLVKFGEPKRIDGREVHNATIDIEDTLKKDLFTIEPYTLLSVSIPAPASVLADWTKRSCRLLVAHDSDAPNATTVIELTEGKVEVMRADLTLLRNQMR